MNDLRTFLPYITSPIFYNTNTFMSSTYYEDVTIDRRGLPELESVKCKNCKIVYLKAKVAALYDCSMNTVNTEFNVEADYITANNCKINVKGDRISMTHCIGRFQGRLLVVDHLRQPINNVEILFCDSFDDVCLGNLQELRLKNECQFYNRINESQIQRLYVSKLFNYSKVMIPLKIVNAKSLQQLQDLRRFNLESVEIRGIEGEINLEVPEMNIEHCECQILSKNIKSLEISSSIVDGVFAVDELTVKNSTFNGRIYVRDLISNVNVPFVLSTLRRCNGRTFI